MAVTLVASACSSDEERSAPRRVDLAASRTEAPWKVQESVNQLAVTGAEPGTKLGVFDRSGRRLQQGTVDDLGALVFRQVPAGWGYRVQELGTEPAATSGPLRVMSVHNSTPPQSFYDAQELRPGFGYITTRDGTKLSAAVYLPGPPEDGPYPTVVEYSGYSPSNPTKRLLDDIKNPPPGINEGTCRQLRILCETPDQPGSLLASAMGFAVVAVNMRGTGCSGGSYDFFEPLQLLDGYDVIETVAAQDWVLGGKVGMVGLSYPAVAQLFVASTQPPHLAAITPLSVYDDTARGVLAPGGIFNSGFALTWAKEVYEAAGPYGQEWTKKIVENGDRQCAENQQLRGQNVDPVARARAEKYYDGKIADPLNPMQFGRKIRVPLFLACAFQDEQTGGRCARLTRAFPNSPLTRFTFYNGAHGDGFAPQILVEWKAFLDLYVGDGPPEPINPVLTAFAGEFMKEIFGVSVPFPEQRWLGYPDAESARKAFEAEEPVRVIFESGGDEPLGGPVGRFEIRTTSFPPPEVTAEEWYARGDGKLSTERPGDGEGASRFVFNPDLGGRVTLPGSKVSDAFKALPPYDWEPDAPGDATVFVSEPLAEDRTYIGGANADLWIRSSTDDADIGVTLSEVRPDGREMFVQGGVLRASMRALAHDATELDPNHGGYESDAAPLRPGVFERLQVQIFPFAHVFRKGSRIRLSVHTPGGDRPRWSWILGDYPAGTTVDVGHDARHASRLLLPRAANPPRTIPPRPPCPSLRGQPCREFRPYANNPA